MDEAPGRRPRKVPSHVASYLLEENDIDVVLKPVGKKKRGKFAAELTPVVSQTKKAKSAPMIAKPLSVKQREEEDMEDRFIDSTSVRMSQESAALAVASAQQTRMIKSLPQSAEAPNQREAIRMSIENSNTLLLDWTTPEASRIGLPCKVYWDGDDVWFYARILNYDRTHDKYFVRNFLVLMMCVCDFLLH